MDFLSPEGLRIDGRRPQELRKISAQVGVIKKSSGSASFQLGNTLVMVSVYGPRELEKSSTASNKIKALLQCEFSMANFATGERKKKKGDKRSIEMAQMIVQTFESVILLETFPRSQIDIFVQVIQADGGIKPAMINCTTLALIHAGIPMRDFVCCCAAGFLEGTPLLDLNYVEESAEGPNIPVSILSNHDKIVTLQMDSRLSLDDLEKVLSLAMEGCKAIYLILQQIIKDHFLHTSILSGKENILHFK